MSCCQLQVPAKARVLQKQSHMLESELSPKTHTAPGEKGILGEPGQCKSPKDSPHSRLPRDLQDHQKGLKREIGATYSLVTGMLIRVSFWLLRPC